MKQNRENPFFETYRTPFGTPPFDQIETEQYEPAFDEGIWQLDEEVRAIADNTELPTFENTIIALERSGKLLDKVISAFFNVLNAEADDEMMDISQRVSPKLSESSNNIYLNEQLFARVKSVYDRKDELHLPMEDARLLEKTFEAFCARGAALGPEEKEKYRKFRVKPSFPHIRSERIERQEPLRTVANKRRRTGRTTGKHTRSCRTQG